MESSDEPLFIDTGMNAVRPDLPFVERNAVTAVVRDPKTGKYLGLKWKQIDWDTLVTGGVEEGQTPEEAAIAEVREETGYKNLRLVQELPRYHSKFFHGPKGVNRFAHFRNFLFELVTDEREEISAEEREKHEPLWLSPEELETFRLPDGHRFILNHLFTTGK